MIAKKILVSLIIFSIIRLTGYQLLPIRTEFWGSYTDKKTYSYDHKYYAIQTVEDRMVVVTVFFTDTDEKAGEFSPARAFDFWGICWEKDTYNIWTQSSDIGCYCFEYKNGKWIRNESLKEPDYIVSRYDKVYSENAELQKNIYRSPTD